MKSFWICETQKSKRQKFEILKNNVFAHDTDEILKTVAIYGANASGKSSIIKAIWFCNSLIFNSHNNNPNAVPVINQNIENLKTIFQLAIEAEQNKPEILGSAKISWKKAKVSRY